MKLSGWKRIGIIASIVWILGAGIYTFIAANNSDIKAAGEVTLSCRETGTLSYVCDKRGTDYLARMTPYEPLKAALAAIVPVPLGWGLSYLLLFLVRWVKHGFVQLL